MTCRNKYVRNTTSSSLAFSSISFADWKRKTYQKASFFCVGFFLTFTYTAFFLLSLNFKNFSSRVFDNVLKMKNELKISSFRLYFSVLFFCICIEYDFFINNWFLIYLLRDKFHVNFFCTTYTEINWFLVVFIHKYLYAFHSDEFQDYFVFVFIILSFFICFCVCTIKSAHLTTRPKCCQNYCFPYIFIYLI